MIIPETGKFHVLLATVVMTVEYFPNEKKDVYVCGRAHDTSFGTEYSEYKGPKRTNSFSLSFILLNASIVLILE